PAHGPAPRPPRPRLGQGRRRAAEMSQDDLERFVDAQDDIYHRGVAELRAGRKTSHWMWFVFPQIAGLGRSPTAVRYAISGSEEARASLAHPVIGAPVRE